MGEVVVLDRLKAMLDGCTAAEIEVAAIVRKDKTMAIYLIQGDDGIMFKPEQLPEIIEQLQDIGKL